MAGPVAQILFRTVAAPSWQNILNGVIDQIKSGEREGEDFWVGTTRPVGGSYEGEGRPFIVSVGTESIWTSGVLAEIDATRAFYERHFGLVPDTSVTLSAMCNGPQDHRILGELALAIAERLGGIIDLCGLLMPRKVPDDFLRPVPWSAVRLDVEAFTAVIPGKAVAIPYPTASGREWAAHTVDIEFLRAWLCHSDFYMIK